LIVSNQQSVRSTQFAVWWRKRSVTTTILHSRDTVGGSVLGGATESVGFSDASSDDDGCGGSVAVRSGVDVTDSVSGGVRSGIDVTDSVSGGVGLGEDVAGGRIDFVGSGTGGAQ
jgi:hypothetical protein